MLPSRPLYLRGRKRRSQLIDRSRHTRNNPQQKKAAIEELQKAEFLLLGLSFNKSSSLYDKLSRVFALYAKWRFEDSLAIQDSSVNKKSLHTAEKQRCKEIDLIIFGFSLHEA